MWTLSIGTIVELRTKELSEKSIYDQPSHSLIFDPEDITWNEYFIKDELDGIRSFRNSSFESVLVSSVDINTNNLLLAYDDDVCILLSDQNDFSRAQEEDVVI
ncbi:hypothetical protein INT48_001133 [Thamnidium elegans]|uniref:Uncharacterized protein n=1 Tax=Thamnidium elegans TaxID=101142 RepID=A0A8H7VZE4_9FUNG|nr:hypothetical protein INT48_001133 [Thamnidium elegans]